MSAGLSAPLVLASDEDVVRALLGTEIRALGYDVREASSADQLLDQLRAEPCDLLIAGARLWGLSNLELLARVRQRSRLARVLLIVAHGSIEEALDAFRRGASDYIVRSADDPRSLERRLQAVLGRPREACAPELRLEALDLPEDLRAALDTIRLFLDALPEPAAVGG